MYGAVLGPDERGRRERALKHQPEDEYRVVPLIADARASISEHIDRGYSSAERTWLSPTGRGHLDFGNLADDYWRPALTRLFAGTARLAASRGRGGMTILPEVSRHTSFAKLFQAPLAALLPLGRRPRRLAGNGWGLVIGYRRPASSCRVVESAFTVLA